MKEKKRIKIVAYNPLWSQQFEALKTVLLKHLKSEFIQIEHVGSTSVKGLKAKPIIDLDIIIKKGNLEMPMIIAGLETLGYQHLGNLGISGREAFKRLEDTTPRDGSNKVWFKHNLYVCEEDSIGLQNHLIFRNYLRNHPQKVLEYGAIKEQLAMEYPHNIDLYIDGKTDFIIDILSKAGLKEEDQKRIDSENRV